MKRISAMNLLRAMLTVALTILPCINAFSSEVLSFRSIPSKLLPTNAVRVLFSDSEGYVWIPTYSGLVRYDGSSTVVFGMNESDGEKFDCHINVVCESEGNKLWIASEKGVYTLDKNNGQISFAGPDPRMGTLNASDIRCSNGRDVWVGGSSGLWHIEASTGEFTPILMDGNPIEWVSSICEDAEGYLWVCCCEHGLYRYDTKTFSFRKYSEDRLYWSNVAYKDLKGRLWVGTWGKGLLRIDAPHGPGNLSCTVYSNTPEAGSLLDDVIYDIGQDSEGRLMVASRSGLSILEDISDPLSFVNYAPGEPGHDLPYNEVSSILRTDDGNIWLSMFCGGVFKVENPDADFRTDALENIRKSLRTNSVRSIFPMPDGRLWLGITGFGMVLYDPFDGSFLSYEKYPAFRDFPYTSTVDVISRRRSTSEICFGTYSQGLWLLDPSSRSGARRVISEEYPDFSHLGVTAIAEDNASDLWIGTRNGVFVMTPGNKVFSIADYLPDAALDPLSDVIVTDLKSARDGSVWIATNYNGVYRLSPSDGSLVRWSLGESDNVSCLFVDPASNVWAGSSFDGLYLYDRKKGEFSQINNISALYNKGITGMSSDITTRLWVTTSDAAVSFTYSEGGEIGDVDYISLSDHDAYMSFNASTLVNLPDGTVAAGSSKGIVYFPLRSQTPSFPVRENLCLTDFRLGETSLRSMSPKQRRKVCEKDINYADLVRIDHTVHSFSISFALLNKGAGKQDIYSYILEGYDRKEVIDAEGRHIASYENVPPGNYVFRLKTLGRDKIHERTLRIKVLRHPLMSSWAIMAYLLVSAALAYGIWRYTYDRIKARELVKLSRIEKQKAEELNHLKLQFYTNVTHELMTPLSIINASVESLTGGKWNPDLPKVLSINTTRLTRLLQQMLEFRKVESGNLKLSVSRGNLTKFISSCVEAFSPLIAGKAQNLSFTSSPDQIEGWYDTDKVDKIVYNLLSNAAKYTPKGGDISVKVSSLADGMVMIDVVNTGDTMSEKTIKGLFKRFYEGDYRKHNTIGTGIGLSLVKDLVTLHKGEITVSSSPEQGNVFSVRLPISEEVYEENETGQDTSQDSCPVLNTATVVLERPEGLSNDYTILFVDDNQELCYMVKNMLAEHFNVLTSRDGKEALEILEHSDVSLVVSDVMMPQMDGLELCRTIKSRFEYCHIPVILLTAKSAEESQIEGWQAGTDGYVCKPFSMKLLYAQIVECLRKIERKGADFRKQIVLDVDNMEYTSMDKTFLRRAIDCVNAHYKDCDFDLPEFVSSMGTSKTVLTEKLKALTGMSPGAFIKNLRMTVAYKALTENKDDVRISDIAFSVGFNDPKYFSACFKKKYGMTPKAYLDSIRGQVL